jgi:hypothetical protein
LDQSIERQTWPYLLSYLAQALKWVGCNIPLLIPSIHKSARLIVVLGTKSAGKRNADAASKAVVNMIFLFKHGATDVDGLKLDGQFLAGFGVYTYARISKQSE